MSGPLVISRGQLAAIVEHSGPHGVAVAENGDHLDVYAVRHADGATQLLDPVVLSRAGTRVVGALTAEQQAERLNTPPDVLARTGEVVLVECPDCGWHGSAGRDGLVLVDDYAQHAPPIPRGTRDWLRLYVGMDDGPDARVIEHCDSCGLELNAYSVVGRPA